jgi:hypothetical protein
MAQITERNLTVDERELVDTVYRLWSKTTGAGDCEWFVDGNTIEAHERDGWEHLIGHCLGPEDAEFIAAIHNALPELVRRYHAALDEAERTDQQRDGRECRIAELEMEVAELKEDLAGLVG